MGKRTEEEAPASGEPVWMGTLSDLIFLLITFFVLLISMSSMDTKQVKEAFGMFDGAMGVLNFPKDAGGSDSFISVITPISHFMADSKNKTVSDDSQKAAHDLLSEMAQAMSGAVPVNGMTGTMKSLAEKTGGVMKIEKIDDGFSVALPGRILFPANSAKLDEKGVLLLKDIAAILKLWDGNVEVIALGSWHESAAVLGQVINVLEKNWVKGHLIHPEVIPTAKRTIRFVMRNGDK
jgi:chemotaxis protein MotB